MEIGTTTAEITFDDVHLYFNGFLVAKFNQSHATAISLFKNWLETTVSGWELESDIERLEGTITDLQEQLDELRTEDIPVMVEGDL